MAQIIDDKSQYCIPFVLEQLDAHNKRHANNPDAPPFFLGLNGIQGAGKTTLVTILRSTLSSPPYNLPTITFSLDDIYLTRADQLALAAAHPSNPLLQHRGQPSTHDVPLGKQVFASLRQYLPTRIPLYDKSAFHGQGDRVPVEQWETVNDVSNGQERVKVVIFEGWCVGFRARSEDDVREAWEDAVRKRDEAGDNKEGGYKGRLGYVRCEDVRDINEALRAYDEFTDQLDAFIHIDAEDTHYVYDWRQEQESALRASKGTGMTVEEVNNFVDGYYPSYELFTSTLREGVFKPRHDDGDGESKSCHDQALWEGKQLRLVVNRDRKVQQVIRI
ncbi:hypothetical protein AJ80_05670 [Polytolypa hystricis UAMH7299]|uniref:SRP54-type proteins GTP-binding domain-containing protein n=1 Tax=Polytolypa hystricis (strain UAMH7299) TaxID=1447883 RepID=A0A2B7Y1H5_POLH7|nr:hypothetical protein AJ80_05670 [Polytolypa hystricis UAMH7299]